MLSSSRSTVKNALFLSIFLFMQKGLGDQPVASCNSLKVPVNAIVSLNEAGDKIVISGEELLPTIYDSKSLKALPFSGPGNDLSSTAFWAADDGLLLGKKTTSGYEIKICELAQTQIGFFCQNLIQVGGLQKTPRALRYSKNLEILSFLSRVNGVDSPSGVGQELTVVDVKKSDSQKSLILKNFEDNETLNSVKLYEATGDLLISGEYGLSRVVLSRNGGGLQLVEHVISDLTSSYAISKNLDRLFFGTLSKSIGMYDMKAEVVSWHKGVNLVRGIVDITYDQGNLLAAVTSKTGAEISVYLAKNGDPVSQFILPKFRAKTISFVENTNFLGVAGRDDSIQQNSLRVIKKDTGEQVGQVNLPNEPFFGEKPIVFKNGGRFMLGRFANSISTCVLN